MRLWYPLGARGHYRDRPPVGRLIAWRHRCWRILEVLDIHEANWTDEEVAARDESPLWFKPPYSVVLVPESGQDRQRRSYRVPAGHWGWNVYPESGRWPQCSCCGEPMPCRAEEEDREVAASLARMEEQANKLPGGCWACSEPITSRQEAVVYAGMNLDLPGGPEVRFHTRRKCHYSATLYEARWRAEDPSRPRILTWPKCGGSLVIHGDGSSECFGGEEDCRGHETHDHGHLMACYGQSLGCPKECPRIGHPGARPNPRPRRGERALS